jgi:hypothetical protein
MMTNSCEFKNSKSVITGNSTKPRMVPHTCATKIGNIKKMYVHTEIRSFGDSGSTKGTINKSMDKI